MGFNEFLSSIFGNKSTRDMKEIQPWVDKIKAAYPRLLSLTMTASVQKQRNLKNTSVTRQVKNAPRPMNSEPASKM